MNALTWVNLRAVANAHTYLDIEVNPTHVSNGRMAYLYGAAVIVSPLIDDNTVVLQTEQSERGVHQTDAIVLDFDG